MQKKIIVSISVASILLLSTFVYGYSIKAETQLKASNVPNVSEERVDNLKSRTDSLNQQLNDITVLTDQVTAAEKDLTRETLEKAITSLNKSKHLLFKGQFESKLNKIDQEIVAIEKEQKEKEEQLVAAQKKETEQQSYVTNSTSSSSKENKKTVSASTGNKKTNETPSKGTKPNNSQSSKGEGSELTGAKKTGEGDITNHGGNGESGATYEEWEVPDNGEIPWDEFSY